MMHIISLGTQGGVAFVIHYQHREADAIYIIVQKYLHMRDTNETPVSTSQLSEQS